MNMIPFSFNGSDLRVITDEQGEPWLLAKGVADLPAYTDTDQVMRMHCKAPKTCSFERTLVTTERAIHPDIQPDLFKLSQGTVCPVVRHKCANRKPFAQPRVLYLVKSNGA